LPRFRDPVRNVGLAPGGAQLADLDASRRCCGLAASEPESQVRSAKSCAGCMAAVCVVVNAATCSEESASIFSTLIPATLSVLSEGIPVVLVKARKLGTDIAATWNGVSAEIWDAVNPLRTVVVKPSMAAGDIAPSCAGLNSPDRSAISSVILAVLRPAIWLVEKSETESALIDAVDKPLSCVAVSPLTCVVLKLPS
jgi:hypothetical protein